MSISDPPRFEARRIAGAPAAAAGLIFCPVPGGTVQCRIPGLALQANALIYPESDRQPGRLMIALAAPEGLPDTVSIELDHAPDPMPSPGPLPELTLVSTDRKTTGMILRDMGEVVLSGPDGVTLGLRLGLESGDGLFWWDWVTARELWTGPICSAWRVGGYAGVRREDDGVFFKDSGDFQQPALLHQHGWLFCELHLLMFAGGVVDMRIRHINNRFFDRGGHLDGITPLIGLRPAAAQPGNRPGARRPATPAAAASDWQPLDEPDLRLGNVTVNMRPARSLTSPADPPLIRWRDGLLHYRPYRLAAWGLAGVSGARDADGQPLPATDNETHRFPRGMARTVRLTLSLGAAPPRIDRFLLPAWHYARCGALWPDTVLPVRGSAGTLVDRGCDHLRRQMLRNCFDEGSVARGRRWNKDGQVGESGWEGETPYALMRAYYLGGDPAVLEDAVRDGYNLADVATDHGDNAVRMHGQGPDARSLPMQRILGMLAAYLETGDPYLLETAQAVADNAYWWDRKNWPRRAFGRDAAYIRGLVQLADVLDRRHYLERAREVLHRCVSVQRPDGAFSDQGGTTGIHAMVNDILKPWMNSIMADAMCDFLERVEDPLIEAALLRLAGWIGAVALPAGAGRVHWTYKYRHGDNPGEPRLGAKNHRFPTPPATLEDLFNTADQPVDKTIPGPQAKFYRALLLAARRRQDPMLTELCFRNLDIPFRSTFNGIDQNANKNIENGAWFDSHLWNARWDGTTLCLDPAPIRTGRTLKGRITLPTGATVNLRLTRRKNRWVLACDGDAPCPITVQSE